MKKILSLAIITFCFSAMVNAQSTQTESAATPAKVDVVETTVTNDQMSAAEAEAAGIETKATKKSCGSKKAKAGCCSSKKGKASASANDKDCCVEAKASGKGCDHAKADARPKNEE